MRAMRRAPLLILLAACEPDKTTPPAGTPVTPLSPPMAAVVAATSPGVFRTGCTIAMDLVDAGTGSTYATAQVTGADGGQWGAVEIVPEVLYEGAARWDTCTNLDTGTGTEDISGFSGEDGILFVFRYSGSIWSFETLYQREDYEGGGAVVTFEDDADAGAIEDAADALGLTSTQDGPAWHFAWTDETAVAEVLSAMSAVDGYEKGEPVWIDQPDWW